MGKGEQSEIVPTEQTLGRKKQWIDGSYAFHSTEHTMRTAKNKQSLRQAECSVSAHSFEKYIYWYKSYNNINVRISKIDKFCRR